MKKSNGLPLSAVSIPQPTALTVQPLDWNGSFSQINDTYLVIGAANHRKAFQAQVVNLGIVFLFMFFYISFPLLCGLKALAHPQWGQFFWENFFDGLKIAIQLTWFIFIPITIMLYLMLYFTSARAKDLAPIYFNRQRREVCYTPPETNRPIFQPWEQMIAWVGREANFTGDAVMQQSMLGLVFEDPHDKKAYCAVLSAPANALSASLWQAHYNYMEQGPTACPTATPPESRQTLKQQRANLHAQYKQGQHSLLYVIAWYTWHIFTLWQQPYWIAEWDQRTFKTPTLPKQVTSWLEPLPEEQWTQPSDEFKAYQHSLATAQQAGENFFKKG